MKLLVLTQKIDKDDPVLGFFHGWVARLAEKFEEVSVVCLQEGEYNLPENVRIYSLGKKKRKLPVISRTKYLTYFYRYILGLHADYDTVFVHMNQEYVLLGGLLWRAMRKKIYFWRNHAKGGLFTRLAVWLSHKVFYTSSGSFTARFKKAIQMPVGVNTEVFNSEICFRRAERRNPKSETKNKILSLGRISPVKNVHLMVEAAEILKKKNVGFSFDIIGSAVNSEDAAYRKELEKSEAVNFSPAVSNHQTPEIYSAHEIFVNLTPAGSFDKTILEAVACGCLPVIANTAIDPAFNDLTTKLEPSKIAEKIEEVLNWSEEQKEQQKRRLQNYTLENHSLNALMGRLCTEIKGLA